MTSQITEGQTTTFFIDGIKRMEIWRLAPGYGAFPNSIGHIGVFDTDGIKSGEQIYRLGGTDFLESGKGGKDCFEVHTMINGREPEMSIIDDDLVGIYDALKAELFSIIKPEWDGTVCYDLYSRAKMRIVK